MALLRDGSDVRRKADALRRFGDTTLDDIWTQIAAYPSVPDCAEIEYLGVAHGWASLVYSPLRWSAVTRAAPPAGAMARLRSCVLRRALGTGAPLECLRVRSARLHGWLVQRQRGVRDLFTLAHRTVGDDRCLSLAERAAWHCWQAGGSVSPLCCWCSGQAYSLLNLHRHNGDPAWLRRARELTARA